MTVPGPKPKPTAIRKFEGNPANRPLNEREPTPEEIKNAEPVDWLSADCDYMILDRFPTHEVSKMIWNELSPQLIALGVLTNVDKGLFGRYCETFARWLKMKAFIDKNGEAFPVYSSQFAPVRNEDGSHATHPDGKLKYEYQKTLKKMSMFPQVAIYKSLGSDLRRYEAEFGIGAASRTRIQTVVESALKGGGQPADAHDFNYAAQRGGLRAVK